MMFYVLSRMPRALSFGLSFGLSFDILDAMTPPKHLQVRTVSEEVADRLRTEILAGDIEPGERLRQAEVARRLGVSTSPVREAFALLRAQGLVSTVPHRGVVVSLPTAQDVTECYEIRIPLESLAIERAIPHVDDRLVRKLQSILDKMARTKNLDRWTELNSLFHSTLCSASKRTRLCEIIVSLSDASLPFVRLHQASYPPDAAQREHQEILDAVVAGDAARAQEATRVHLQHTVDAILGLLHEPDGPQPSAAAPKRSAGQ